MSIFSKIKSFFNHLLLGNPFDEHNKFQYTINSDPWREDIDIKKILKKTARKPQTKKKPAPMAVYKKSKAKKPARRAA